MRRRKNTRPTNIYWLVDTRTGVPFYCGKTVMDPARRLLAHNYDAKKGTTRVNVRVRECGDSVRVDLIEVVPVGEDWSAREKHWIATLRIVNPNCCNTVDGGAGCPGRIVSEETRAKLRAIFKGRSTNNAESRAKISASLTGKKRSPESVAKSAAGIRGKKHTPEALAKMRMAQSNRGVRGPHSPEHCAKISAANKGKQRTPETIAKLRAANCSTRFKPGQRPHNARCFPPCPVPLP